MLAKIAPRGLALAILIATVPSFMLAQEAAGDGALLWLRHPAISPDGSTIVFSYQGDLYRVASDGGRATPLTVWDGHDSMPIFSPDGRWLAFASDRYGNFDVYLMPARGGRAERLTHHSANDVPSDFSVDGSAVLFSSQRLDAVASVEFPSARMPELYRVSTAGGRVEQVLTSAAEDARYLADGRLVYHDKPGIEDGLRKHHTSSVARDLWLYDPASGAHTQLTDDDAEERSPRPVDGDSAVVYLSEADGTFNVYRRPIDAGSDSEQLTRFERHPVRFLSAADDGLLCFAWNGEIYTLRAGEEPRRVAIELAIDLGRRGRQLAKASGEATEMAVAPSGKEVAFVVRGEVFVASVEKGTTRRITDTPEQERSVSFRPDGRALLYAGERGGSWQLYQSELIRDEEPYFFGSTVLQETAILESEAETFQPSYSPDGKEVAYLEARTTLKVLNLASGQSRTILAGDRNFSYADGDQHYRWSPDGRWFLVEYLPPGYWFTEVGLVAADGESEVVNTTLSGYYDFAPKWMMGGKMMLWFSDRDGLKGHANAGPRQADVYAQLFTREAWERSLLDQEEIALLDEGSEDDGDEDSDEDSEGTDDDGDDENGDDGDPIEPIEIELDGLRDRRARLTIHSSRLADAVVTPDGEKLFYLTRFEKGLDLWQTELRTKDTKILVKLGADGGGSLALDKEGKNLFLLADGSISKIDVASGERKPIRFSGELSIDRHAERAHLFEHVWRQVKRKFYDPELHGAEWDALKADYARFLPHVNNNYDFADLLGELLGELNASHTGARYRPRHPDGDATAALGLFFDAEYDGAGLRIAEVVQGGPTSKKDSRIGPGVVLEKIDGAPIGAGENHLPLLNRKAGKKVLLGLHDPAAGERWDEVVEPISLSAERQLLYDRWVEGRRHAVEDLSDGRLGYVHVRNMSDRSFRVVYEEVLGRYTGADGLVVDTRWNTGGDLVNDLSIFLSGEAYMDFRTRDGRNIGGEPQQRWNKPSVVLVGEGNYSDAHCFPWAYQHLGIGKVVGMPVAGTCTFVWWERLQDRTLVFGIPNLAVTDMAGRPLENWQLEPDVEVRNDFAAVAAGRDPQLERAVEELLASITGSE